MKKLLSLLFLVAITITLKAQTNVRIEVRADRMLDPGSIETVSVTIQNITKSPIDISRGTFNLVIHYDGSANAGQVFNQIIRLPKTIQPGESYTFNNISFKSPIHPGNYPVEYSLRVGNTVRSNVETVNFMVDNIYEASISAERQTLPDEPDTDLKFTVTNSGKTAWPEGNYTIKFTLYRGPSAATTTDKNRFNITPRQVEKWDFEPGESDVIIFRNFILPRVTGDYVVRIQLLLNDKPFTAEGAKKEITFKIKL
jgi:hypothetical protein